MRMEPTTAIRIPRTCRSRGTVSPSSPAPSDTPQLFSPNLQITKHNYAVNYGTQSPGSTSTFGEMPFSMSGGLTSPPHQTNFGEISDGLSQTLMAAEVVQGHDAPSGNPYDLRGLIWWGYAAGMQTYLTPNAYQPDVLHASYYCYPDDPANPPCYGPHSIELPLTMGRAKSTSRRNQRSALRWIGHVLLRRRRMGNLAGYRHQPGG